MADYREISQEYARGGIKAAILLNGGAAVALLSQAADLVQNKLAAAVTSSMVLWAFGTTVAALTWIVAFFSTRYVDVYVESKEQRALRASNWLMYVGGAMFLASILMFLCGCIVLARSLGAHATS